MTHSTRAPIADGLVSHLSCGSTDKPCSPTWGILGLGLLAATLHIRTQLEYNATRQGYLPYITVHETDNDDR
jgi:hypothetical protein